MAIGQLAVTPKRAMVSEGDDWCLGFTLWDNGAVKDVSGGTIKAAVQGLNGQVIIESVTQSSATTGAAWATGIVVIIIDADDTDTILPSEYRLEIEYTSAAGKRTTWPLIPIEVQGTVIE